MRHWHDRCLFKGDSEMLTMKTNAEHCKLPASKKKAVGAREEAARQLRDSELAAKEVADLCAKAVDRARLAHVPHAGVGTSPEAVI